MDKGGEREGSGVGFVEAGHVVWVRVEEDPVGYEEVRYSFTSRSIVDLEEKSQRRGVSGTKSKEREVWELTLEFKNDEAETTSN